MKISINPHNLRIFLAVVWLLALCISPTLAVAEDDEDTLALFSAWQESSSSAIRAPKPLSQTAENITIITRVEIEALNAHTLTDVLATVPGVQVEQIAALGGMAYTRIQGSSFYHILVMVDGIPLNTLGENYSYTSSVPARIIERVEIVKGAA